MQRLLVLAILTTASGCATMDLKGTLPWSKKDEKFQRPHRMVTIWTDTVLHQAGKPSTRGFGGRVYFYDEVSNAIPVEGTLVVYAFDESQGEALSREPDRKFVFRPEEFVRHAEKTSLGQSYSVWLPWDELGGVRSQITLLPMFTTTEGEIVAGQQSKHVLPGKEPVYYEPPGQVQQASYQAPDSAGRQRADFKRELRTTSIPMTDTLKQRLINSRPAEPQHHPVHPNLLNPVEAQSLPPWQGASLRTTGGGAQQALYEAEAERGYQTAGDAYQGESQRIAATLAEAQVMRQVAARGGAHRNPQTLAQSSTHFGRPRSPVPGGAAVTPIPGPAHWPPFPGPPPFGQQMIPGGPPQTPLPAAVSTAPPPLN